MGIETRCMDTRPCFGKHESEATPGKMLCDCLDKTAKYPDGKCPFCKTRRDVTNGRVYPYNRNYGKLTI